MFQTKVVEKIKTHTLCSVIFARKLWCEKILCSRRGHRWQYNTTHALCVPHN